MNTLVEEIRFNHDVDTIDEAKDYLNSRAKQLLRLDYKLLYIHTQDWGVSAFFTNTKTGKIYQSIYILASYRKKGIYKQQVQATILTSIECKITDFLHVQHIDYIVEDLVPFKEYQIIADYYGNQKAKRSKVSYMNHIDEGLAILQWIGASENAKKAYCLHPIYQGDEDLLKNFNKYEIDGDVMLLVMEYRSVANDYLSMAEIDYQNNIRLSPLKDVNDMLIADKIQNYKDFELYHKGKHRRSDELDMYFKNWLTRLNARIRYNKFKPMLE